MLATSRLWTGPGLDLATGCFDLAGLFRPNSLPVQLAVEPDLDLGRTCNAGCFDLTVRNTHLAADCFDPACHM